MTVTEPELRTGTVGEAMTAGVLTCLPATPLADVARMMARHRVHAIVVLPVDEHLHAYGVVSDLDLIAAIGTHASAGAIAGSPVVTVGPDLPLEHAAALMSEHQTTHLLVVTESGLPVGVLSTLDVARSFGAEVDRG